MASSSGSQAGAVTSGLLSDVDIEAPRGFPAYGKQCSDPRFTPEIRGEVENLCRRILNRRKKLSHESKDEEAWFKVKVQGDKGPLHRIAQHVRSNSLGKGKAFTLVLGASANKNEAFVVSPSTWDFPWFSIVMNELCRESPGPFNAWELSFSEGGHIGARALSDELVNTLPEDMLEKLKKLGFRLTADQVLEPLNLSDLCSYQTRGFKGVVEKATKKEKPPSKQQVEELVKRKAGLAGCNTHLLPPEIAEADECVIQSVKKMRAYARRVRLQGGMLHSDRGARVATALDKFEKTFGEIRARATDIIDKYQKDAAERKTTTSDTDEKGEKRPLDGDVASNGEKDSKCAKKTDKTDNNDADDDDSKAENKDSSNAGDETAKKDDWGSLTLPVDFDEIECIEDSDSIVLSPRPGIDIKVSEEDDDDEPAGAKGFKIFNLDVSRDPPDMETSESGGIDNGDKVSEDKNGNAEEEAGHEADPDDKPIMIDDDDDESKSKAKKEKEGNGAKPGAALKNSAKKKKMKIFGKGKKKKESFW